MTETATALETREFEIRRVNPETRTVEGIAVPFGETITRRGLFGTTRERFERGAFAEMRDDVMLFYGHTAPIGRITDHREADDGLHITAHISETRTGDEVYTLLRDGVLTKFSVGFFPVEHRIENEGTDEETKVRTKVDLREVSVVPIPAYDGAKIADVRAGTIPTRSIATLTIPTDPTVQPREKESHTMPETDTLTPDDLTEIRDSISDLSRRMDTLGDQAGAGPAVSAFRSAGEWLKALAAGDETATAEARATATTDDSVLRPAWVNRALKFVQEKRRIINLFGTGTLPEMGNKVEYPEVDQANTTGTVAKQSSEGEALAYMEVALTTGSATVGTYGGYSRLSRQSIERSDLAYLSAVYLYQAIQYAKATEAATRSVLTAMTGTGTATLAEDTVSAWIDLVVDAAAAIEDDSLGLYADFMVVSRDVFKAIVHKTDSADRPVFALNGDGQNTIGAANIVRPKFSIGGQLAGTVDPKLPDGSCYVAAEESMTTLESAGAPFRLNDEDIVKLTRDFSLYGYLANTTNDAKGIVKCDVSALTGGTTG